MPDRLDRFAMFAGGAMLALLAFPMCNATAQQVHLENIRGLDFGRFVAGSGGTVTLHADGRRTSTGGVILLNSPSTGQAQFNTAPGTTTIMLLPPNGSTRLSSIAGSMVVNDFASQSTARPSSPAGSATLSVGATLVVAPNQAPGNYSGSFSLIVNYQ